MCVTQKLAILPKMFASLAFKLTKFPWAEFSPPPQREWLISTKGGPISRFLSKDDVSEVYISVTIATLLMYAATLLLYTILPTSTPQNKQLHLKKVYRLFNFLINTCFGLVGFYVMFLDPNEWSKFEQNRAYLESPWACKFAHVQFAYQLWSIPIGLLVGEAPLMYIHHILVMGLAYIVAVRNLQFQYYQVYYFGVCECSSIPLAIMNHFKDNKQLREKYAGAYQNVRIAFAVAFLYFRGVLLWKYSMRWYADSLWIWEATRDPSTRQQVLLMNIGVTLLHLMQLWWMYLILKGLFGLLNNNNNNKNKSKIR